MILEHYSAQPVTEIVSKTQNERLGSYDKPRGLWVSVKGDDDWWSWCESEGFAAERRKVVHEVKLNKEAKILRLEGAEAIDEFTTKYAVDDPILKDISSSRWIAINWPKVAEEYQGIIIAPYVWSRRLESHTSWYYGWDCASGCIWDKDAIQSIRVIKNFNLDVESTERFFRDEE